MRNRTTFFVLCSSLILMSSRCTQTKAVLKNSSEFEIINAFTQKMVPGQQNHQPYIEFGFEVKGITNKVILDSVFCEVGKAVAIDTDGRKRLKLTVGEGLFDKMKFSKAIFYYTIQGSKNSYILNKIQTKETMFLP